MSVIFKVFKKDELNNNEIMVDTEYEFNLYETIIDIKNRILKDSFQNSHNYLNMENISERVFKDYGKLFFDKGPVPETIDNYKLEQMTNENRVFLFLCTPINIEIKKNIDVLPKINNKFTSNTMKNKIFPNSYNNNGFSFNENDFPALS